LPFDHLGFVGSNKTMKDKLKELSKLLIRLHKSLIHFEGDQHEKREQRKFSPHEMLHLSLNDSNFAWLRKVSELIVEIDTLVDDKEKPEVEKSEVDFFRNETRKLLFMESEETREFKTKLMSSVAFNSDVVLQLAALRNFIKQNP
jgi:hypothetical protein